MKAGWVAMLLLAGCAQQAQAADFDDLTRQLAANHTHGERHNYTPIGERIELLQDGGLESYCAEVADPAQIIYTAEGFQARRVALLRLTPDELGVHRGHQLLEAWHPERDRWLVVDLDYGLIYDQQAVTLPAGRVAPEWLETARDAGDPDGPLAYPYVTQAVGLMRDGVYWYDATLYTDEQQTVLRGELWRAWPGDFAADFYG